MQILNFNITAFAVGFIQTLNISAEAELYHMLVRNSYFLPLWLQKSKRDLGDYPVILTYSQLEHILYTLAVAHNTVNLEDWISSHVCHIIP